VAHREQRQSMVLTSGHELAHIEGVSVAGGASIAGQETSQGEMLPSTKARVVDNHGHGRFVLHSVPPESVGLEGPSPTVKS
jgi:hypothetical protein